MKAPDWLAMRAGGLHPGLDESTWMVTLNGQPLYRLFAAPAKGRFSCSVTQTNNGKRLDGGKDYASVEAALEGGLVELRATLGW